MASLPVLVCRPLAPGEFDHERLWPGVGLGVAVCLGSAAALGLRPPPCLFHLATGIPCPGCGSTRALRRLLHGDVLGALAYNPLFTTVALAGLAWTFYAVVVSALHLPRLRLGELPRSWSLGLRVGAFAVLAVNWWWVVAHKW